MLLCYHALAIWFSGKHHFISSFTIHAVAGCKGARFFSHHDGTPSIVKGEQLTDEHIHLARDYSRSVSIILMVNHQCFHKQMMRMEMELHDSYVQQQEGITDCKLFAIAFACTLAFGHNVS